MIKKVIKLIKTLLKNEPQYLDCFYDKDTDSIIIYLINFEDIQELLDILETEGLFLDEFIERNKTKLMFSELGIDMKIC